MTPKRSTGKTSENKREIIFLQDEKTNLVRPLCEERKDYDALARCFNTFKDSDSWPGGFGGTFDFTGEFLEKRYKGLDHSSRFIINAPEDENKIVGVSICSKSWNLHDAWYVQLLGVDPAYQGQKLGKALLIESTKYVMKHQAPLISLHTWGGNLKAMPLYKKQGYKWRPNTSCYLENYMPQILVYPVFQEMFEKFSWYDSFRPVINQIADEEFDEKMTIYKYDFEMDEKNSLEVWIDRSIGFISGFHKKTAEEDLLVKATVTNTESYIGFEEFPIILTLRNNGSTIKKLQINAQPTNQINMKGKNKQEISLNPNEEQILQFTANFAYDTPEFNMTELNQNYSNHLVLFDITSDEVSFPIKVGKAPIHALNVTTSPQDYHTIPNHTFSLPFEIKNYLGEEKAVRIEFTDSEFISFNKKNYELKISEYDTTLDIEAEIGKTDTVVDFVKVKVFAKDNTLLHERSLPIPIFNENKSLVYQVEESMVVQNKHYLVKFNTKPQPHSNELYILDKLRKLCVNGNAIILGYPFDDDGSEFFHQQLTHKIKEETNGVWILSSGISDVKKGVEVTRKLFVPTNNEPIGIKYLLENLSEEPATGLGILVGSYWWPGQTRIMDFIYPTNEGIKKVNMFEIPLNYDMKPSSLSEGWRAIEYISGTIGYLCDLSKVDQIRHGRFPRFEYKIDKLDGKSSFETPFTWYCFTDSWQKVRKMWFDKFQHSPDFELEFYQVPEDMSQFGFINELSGDSLAQGLIIERHQKNMEVAFRSSGEATLTGIINVNLDEGMQKPISFEVKSHKGKTWNEEVQLKSTKSYIIGGKITFDCKAKKYDTPIALAFYNHKKKINITKSVVKNKEVLEVNNGFLKFKGSKDFKGYIFHLSPLDDDHNYLLTNFPESKPFLWFNNFYGGLGPIVKPRHVWIGDEKYFDNVTFESYEIEQGDWKGIGFKSNVFNFHPAIKGIQADNRFLTLPDSAVVLGQHVISNLSDSLRKLYTHTTADLQTSKTVKDLYFVQDRQGQIMTYHLLEYEPDMGYEKMFGNLWSAFKKANNKYYFGVTCSTNRFANEVYPYSPNRSHISLTRNTRVIKIKPKEKITINTLYILATDLKQIAPFSKNNLSDLLK